MGNTLNVGVVLDVSQLDAGMARAAATVDESAKAATRGMEKMAAAVTTAGEAGQRSLLEARHAAMLFGEEIGVRIPRALATVAARSELLGPVLNAAFGAVALVAFADLIGGAIEKMSKFREASEKAVRETMELSIAAIHQGEAIALANLRLEDSISLLEGRPKGNVLAAALVEAQIKADQLGKSLQDDIVKAVNLFEESNWAGQALHDVLGLGSNEGDIKGQMQPILTVIEEARTKAALATAGSKEHAKALEDERQGYEQLAKDAKQWISIVDPGETAAIQKLQSIMRQATASAQALAEEQKNASLSATKDGMEAAHKRQEILDRENVQKLKAADETSKHIAGLLTAEYAMTAKFAEDSTKVFNHAADERQRHIQEAARKRLEEERRTADQDLKDAEALAKAKERTADALADYELNTHKITLAQATQIKLDALNQEFAAEKAAIMQRIAAFDALDPDSPRKRKELYAQLLVLQQDYQTQKLKIETQGARDDEKIWKHMSDEINRGMEQVTRELMQGTVTIGQAFERMAGDILMTMVQAFEKILVEEILYLATSGALGKAHALGDIMRSAYQAAAKVFAEVPFPLNYAVAPVVFATVAAMGGSLSSAEGGMWRVPANQLAMLHTDESVLPANIARPLRASVESGGGLGGGAPINVHYQIHALDASGVESVLNRNADALVRVLRRARREGRL